MSRTRKALLTSAASYLQIGLGMGFGFVLFPIAIGHLGDRDYGYWLALVELLGLIALGDLGVLRVLPWLFAAANGRGDISETRRLMANAAAIATTAGVVVGVAAVTLWQTAPHLLVEDQQARDKLAGPLALLVACIAVTYPLRVNQALLQGRQDVVFNGLLGATTTALSFAATLTMLRTGFGIAALAVGQALSQVTIAMATLVRVLLTLPETYTRLPWPSARESARLLGAGLGTWLGGLGVMLVHSFNGVILLQLGLPAAIPIYLATAKLAFLALTVAWVLPDGALVGLAEVHGESRATRTFPIVRAIVVLNVALAGQAACLVAVVNPWFVPLWIDQEHYGGDALHALLVVNIVVASMFHGVGTCVAVLGRRVPMGSAVVVQGLLHVGLSFVLIPRMGLAGLPASLILSSLVSSLPACVFLLAELCGVRPLRLLQIAVLPSLARTAPCVLLALAVGTLGDFGPATRVAGGCLLSAVSMRLMIPLTADFPWPARLRKFLGLPPTSRATPWPIR